MLRKILTASLILVAVATLTACGDSEPTAEQKAAAMLSGDPATAEQAVPSKDEQNRKAAEMLRGGEFGAKQRAEREARQAARESAQAAAHVNSQGVHETEEAANAALDRVGQESGPGQAAAPEKN